MVLYRELYGNSTTEAQNVSVRMPVQQVAIVTVTLHSRNTQFQTELKCAVRYMYYMYVLSELHCYHSMATFAEYIHATAIETRNLYTLLGSAERTD